MPADGDARQLLAEAEKKAKYTGWFGGNKLEEASELYVRAANGFKLAKQCIGVFHWEGDRLKLFL